MKFCGSVVRQFCLICCRQLKLDIVGVAECEDVQPKGRAHILNLPVWHIVLIKDLDSVIKLCATADREAQVVKPYTKFIKTIAVRSVWPVSNTEDKGAIAEDSDIGQRCNRLESKQALVERYRVLALCDPKRDMVDWPEGDLICHGGSPSSSSNELVPV